MEYTVIGKIVRCACPNCGERLVTRLRQAGTMDTCPACKTEFECGGVPEYQRKREAQMEKQKLKEKRNQLKSERNSVKREQKIEGTKTKEQIKEKGNRLKSERKAEKSEQKSAAAKSKKQFTEERNQKISDLTDRIEAAVKDLKIAKTKLSETGYDQIQQKNQLRDELLIPADKHGNFSGIEIVIIICCLSIILIPVALMMLAQIKASREEAVKTRKAMLLTAGALDKDELTEDMETALAEVNQIKSSIKELKQKKRKLDEERVKEEDKSIAWLMIAMIIGLLFLLAFAAALGGAN